MSLFTFFVSCACNEIFIEKRITMKIAVYVCFRYAECNSFAGIAINLNSEH